MLDRLNLFRGYFERLDPAASPLRALREEMYVDPPGRAVGEQLAARLQLAPTSAHLIVGSVGGGKTTQLLRAAELLRATGDTLAVYVDVSRRHDIDKDLNGVLVVLAGLELSRVLRGAQDPDVKAVRQQFSEWAHGHYIPWDPRDEEYDWSRGEPDDDHSVWQAGVLEQPLPPLPSGSTERIEALRTLKAALPEGTRHFVILFDSLDRLYHVEAFQNAAAQDVRALRQAGIGLAIVGPARLVWGQNRHIVDIFDQLHSVPAIDVANDSAGRDFLTQVIARRSDEAVLNPQIRSELIAWSGGILRDLLGLTRSAVEEAFVAGADAVDGEHVARAVDQFGRSMMIGLGAGELETLQRLRRRGTFVPTGDEHLALLTSRRVVEYPGVTVRYAVHPTIEPLLAALETK